MYKLIVFALLFLLFVIIVAFLLARRERRKENLQFVNIPRKVGGLARKITSNMPMGNISESRKLSGNMLKYKLLTSIEFLTNYSKFNSRVIFLGTAPAKHIIFLRKLFPNQHYIIIKSGKKLDKRVKNLPNVEIIDDVTKLPKYKYLFISYLDPSKENLIKVRDIISKLQIKTASIRFQPYPNMSYFAGDLYIPPYVIGADLQLITRGVSTQKYHRSSIMNRLAFFNQRMKLYGYDDQVNRYIIDEFSDKVGHKWIKEKIISKLNKFVESE